MADKDQAEAIALVKQWGGMYGDARFYPLYRATDGSLRCDHPDWSALHCR